MKRENKDKCPCRRTLYGHKSNRMQFMKTLFGRMGNVKMGRLVDPETEEDLSQVEAVLGGVGISLRDSNKEFRDFGSVLDDVAANWGSYGSVQQRAIAVAFSGIRQQEKF